MDYSGNTTVSDPKETPKRPKGRCGYKIGMRFVSTLVSVVSLIRGKVGETQMRERIAALDLSPIIYKLMHAETGESWTRAKCDELIPLYRNFLVMAALGQEVVIPTLDIDHIWHTHILDTEKYAQDCQHCFGFFLHHFPYLGMRGEEDKQALQAAFQIGQQNFAANFGMELTGPAANCPGGCGGGCSRRYEYGLSGRRVSDDPGGGGLPLHLNLDTTSRPTVAA